jgi:hypothetical protein
MTDLTFGVRLDGSSSTLVSESKAAQDELNNLKKSTDDLAAASANMASGATTDFTAIQNSLNAMAIAEDNARDKAWALANGYKDVGGQMVQTSAQVEDGMTKSSHASAGMTRELIVLGHEAVSGNFSKMPGTLMVLAERSGFALTSLAAINPVVLAIGAAVAAGVVAWVEWGKSAEEASKRAAQAAADAGKDAKAAWAGVHKTIDEDIQNVRNQIAGATGQLQSAIATNSSVTGSTSAKDAAAAGEAVIQRKSELLALERQLTDLLQKKQDIQDKLDEKEGAANLKAITAHEKILEQNAREYADGQAKVEILQTEADTGTKLTASQQAIIKLNKEQEQSVIALSTAEYNRKVGILASQAAAEVYYKESESKAVQHTNNLLINEQMYLAKATAAADAAGKTAQQREDKRYLDEIANWNKRHDRDKANKDYSVALETAYQQELLAIQADYLNRQLLQQGEVGAMMLAFKRGNMDMEITSTLDYLTKLSSYSASHNKAMFELNKEASTASAIVNTYLAASKIFAEVGGGPW